MTNCDKYFTFHSILENVMRILQYDFSNWFASKETQLCEMEYPATVAGQVASECRLQHNYGRRPLIYDGNEDVAEIHKIVECLKSDVNQSICKKLEEEGQTSNWSADMQNELLSDDSTSNDYSFDSSDYEVYENMDVCSTPIARHCPNQSPTPTNCSIRCNRKQIDDSRTTQSCRIANSRPQQNNKPTPQSCSFVCNRKQMNRRNNETNCMICPNTNKPVSDPETNSIEERANKLWSSMQSKDTNCAGELHYNWWNLKAFEKLPFYWAAMSNKILSEDPFENFDDYYMSSSTTSKASSKQLHTNAGKVWQNLAAKQKLPFVMEAFIAKIGAGKVNMSEEHEIKRVVKSLQNK